jgi:hypothetical protein
MAKSSNTWCKKLMHKAKVHALKSKLGNEEGVLARSGGENYYNRQILNDRRAQLAKYKHGVVDGDMPDKPLPKAPKLRENIQALPRVAGWKPRPFGKRGMSGSVLR